MKIVLSSPAVGLSISELMAGVAARKRELARERKIALCTNKDQY
jgi:hypothetical protein